MKKTVRKLLSLVLVFTLLLQISGEALAAVGNLLGNTSAQNNAIYEQLSELTGGTSAEARALLERLGLLDEKGNLDLTASITMDGKPMTVDAVRAMLDDPATDLTKIVSVDGTPVSLSDLKIMLQIEAELARIQSTYFSGKTFGAEATENLNSLMNQIENEGISLYGQTRSAQSPYLSFSYSNREMTLPGNDPEYFRISLEGLGGQPLAQDVSFKVRFQDANARPGTKLTASGSASFSLALGEETTVTIPKGTAAVNITVAVTPGTAPDLCKDTGKHLSYLQFTDGVGVAMDSSLNTGTTFRIVQPCKTDFSWNSMINGLKFRLSDFAKVKADDAVLAENGVLGGTSMSNFVMPVILPRDKVNFDGASKTEKQDINSMLAALDGVDLAQRGISLDIKAEAFFGNLVGLSPRQDAHPLVLGANDIHIDGNICRMHPKTGTTPNITIFAGGNPSLPLSEAPTVQTRVGRNETKPELNAVFALNYPVEPTILETAFNPGNDILEATSGCRVILAAKTTVPEASYVLSNLCDTGLNVRLGLENYVYTTKSLQDYAYSAFKDLSATSRLSAGSDGTVYTATNHFRSYLTSSTVTVTETKAPTVASVAAGRGIYSLGQIVPIQVTFDEPVKCEGLSIVANGVTLSSCACKDKATSGGISAATTHVFHYSVQRGDATQVLVTSVAGGKDVFDNAMNAPTVNYPLTDVTLEACFVKDAVTAAAAAKTPLPPTEAAGGTQLKLTLDQATGYKTKYTNYPAAGKTAPYFARLVGGDGTLIPFQLQETGNTVSAVADTGALSFGTTAKTYTYQIVCHEQKNKVWDTSTYVNTGKTVAVTVNPMVFVNGLTVNDTGDKRELSLTDPYVPTLTVEFTGSPTFKTGAWSSSDTDIATIDAKTGAVTLSGKKLGEVTFTFTADDGALGLTDPSGDAASKVKFATSPTYTVTAGAEAGIVVPKGGDSIVALEKSETQVRWYGNLAQYLDPENTTHVVTYTLEVFEGNWPSDTDFTEKTPIYSVDGLDIGTNSHKIPAEKLTALSVGGTPAYTVRISAPHPRQDVAQNGIKLYTYAYIIVNPIPVTVKLTPPESLYALDSAETSSVSWSIENFKEDTTTATLTVERVDETGVATKVVDGKQIATASGDDSFELAAVPEGELRALYVVTVAAKNASDTAWNTDSYQFYVYNSKALDIVVGEAGAKEDSILLSNRDKNMDSLPGETDAIMALRDQLGLNAPIGINYNDYAWSALKDGIAWSSEDDSKVSLNFKQGGFYEDIRRFGYSTYLPSTTMAIAGLGETDGTEITATHANTGMSTSINVKVESLQNRLYLFQATPMLATTLTYTDGKGTEKTVKTNGQGTLALYEPEGITGPVYFRAVDAGDGDALYLGTLSAQSIRSGEGNTLLFELYPLNSITLRKVARTDLYLKKPDGTPYAGQVTVRGGVYKNGGYCQEAQLGINNSPLKDGKAPQIVTTGADGKLTIQMDVTQFWSSEKGETHQDGKLLKSTDKLEYIFELTGMSGSCPALCYVNGVSPVVIGSRTGEGVVTLEAASKTPQLILTWQQALDKNGDVRNVRYRPDVIGPNEVTPDGTELVSTVLLWGESNLATKDYTVTLLDEFGFQPAAQKSETITYPFSSIPVVRSTLTLTPDSMTKSGWIPEGDPRGLKVQVLKGGALQKEIPTDLKAADLSNAPKLKGETAQNIMVDLTKGSGLGGQDMGSDKNKVLNGLMGLLGDVGGPVDTSNFKMIISPGDDAATFKAFIWAGYNSLGLEDVEYDGNGLSVEKKVLEQDLSLGFGAEDAADLAGGAAKEAAQSGKELASTGKSVSSGGSFGGQLEGYYDALIKFNFKTQKWEIFTLGGGFTVGFGGSFGKSINQMAGPIPITASFELGAAIQLDFKMASRYKVMGDGLEWREGIDSQYVTDFLTTLRINAYFEAFGGVGFDLSIVALKFGIFGKIAVDNSNAFLSRTYLANESLRQLNGQAVKLTGEVGIKFVLKVIGISYEAVLASVGASWSKNFRDWDKIQTYWANTGSGLEQQAAALAAFSARSGLTLVSAEATMESRDYLDDFDRTWGAPATRLRSIDPNNGLSSLQTNAYPFTLPRITDDGAYLLYAFDQNSDELTDTRIYATAKGGNGKYPEGSEITAPDGFTGYGDSDLRLAGKKDFAVAAWIRQNTDPMMAAGEEVKNNTQAVLMNATDIVASVNTGGGWVSTRITDNGTPDLAPVVATNGGKAIVAWRSVYSGDSDKPMDFTVQDNVLYKIYNGAAWGETKTLYPGTSGSIKGIEAAMLPSGEAAVVYTLDRAGKGISTDYEMACSIVKENGDPGRTIMLTNDSYVDENPQIAAVECGADDQRFVIGWYSVRDGVGDIRMAALDKDGLPSATFPESLSQISKTVTIGNNFRFVAADKLENLSIMWALTGQNQNVEGDRLLAVKFLPEGKKIGLSAAMDVATLPKNTALDHFDAYVSDPATNEIKAVLQGTEYKTDVFDIITDDNGEEIRVPRDETKLFTATETYKNTMTLSGLWADYENLAVNSLVPVQFTVTNSGFETLEKVKITLGKSVKDFEVNLAPNESATLTLYHPTGTKIENVGYSIVPTFGATTLKATAGTFYLDYPDTGIAAMQVLDEAEGERDLRLTLYNAGAAKLAGSGRTLKVAFYDNSFLEGEPVAVNGSQKVISISGDKELTLADNGALCVDATFDLDGYLDSKNLKESGEIPAAGMRLYAKVWVEDSGKELPEFRSGNNTDSVQLESLLTRAGQPVTITVAQNVSGGKTTADVTVRNNSLKPVDGSGNVTATLLDKNGRVLETLQSYQPQSRAINNGLITLNAEESVSVPTFAFQEEGASVKVTYGELVLNDDTNAELASLSATGIPVRVTDFAVDAQDATKYTAKTATAAASTLIVAAAKDPGAAVVVNGVPLAAGGTILNLSTGENTVTVEVTARNNTDKRTYVLTVERTTSDPSSGMTYAITATAGEGGVIAPSGRSQVAMGGSKTYTITPHEGYAIADVLVDGVSVGKKATYTFTKVKAKHTIEARFAPIVTTFRDVSAQSWYFDAVTYAAQHGLMEGTGDGNFTPLGNTSRATVVTVLYRIAGSPDVKTEAPFTDVGSGKWYSDAVAWAAETGVAQGSESKFTPDADVTREQLAQFLYNFAKLQKDDLSKTNDLSAFTDAPTGWSRSAMQWAVGSGLITGKEGGILDPGGKATRAELATMLMRAMYRAG